MLNDSTFLNFNVFRLFLALKLPDLNSLKFKFIIRNKIEKRFSFLDR